MANIDLVDLVYKFRKEEKEQHQRTEGVYWVTDLTRCLLKREYELKYPELVAKDVFSPVFIMGDLAHRGIESLIKEFFLDAASVEVEGSREVVLPNGQKVIIKGRADAIIDLGEGIKVGVEVKTARADVGIPQPHHIDQVRIYNWLFNLKYSILFYVTPDRITQYEVSDRVSEEEIIERITSTTHPRYSWECSYCPFSVLCPHKKTGNERYR